LLRQLIVQNHTEKRVTVASLPVSETMVSLALPVLR
jgi:hypothetical protein